MTDAATPVWRTTGIVWKDGQALLEWLPPAGFTPRLRPLPVDEPLAFRTGRDRRCVGLWASGQRHRCPNDSPIPAERRTGQCELCAASQRSSSIATDTRLDDPRPFAVYLAHYGAQIKVGITAAERGLDRLVEQGALASVFLSAGPLLAARRAEHLLGAALGLPDRVATRTKHDARVHLAPPSARAEQLRATATAALGLPGWPDTQMPAAELTVTDHAAGYGLPTDGIVPVAEVEALQAGHTVTGDIVCRIADDLYLAAPTGVVLLDTRLLTGWELRAAALTDPFTAPLRVLHHEEEPDALF